ncbi:MAG: AmmeMemoRadiSam system protein B [Planctomycetes bacterium]|nr:AmmeMemoRadiSam system protein B [Planctomycetota bacterium]
MPDRVVIVAPKHTRLGMPWAVAPHETWVIPGGEVASDLDLARRLADAVPGLTLDAAAHREEHAVEVQLPLLTRLAPRARVVGITIGGGDLDHVLQFARCLADALRAERELPLLVISSDMNHYAADEENRRLDRLALDALRRLDPAHLYDTVSDNDISMCGVLPAVIVLETLRQLDRLHACQDVGYATSADAGGSSDRVVGYAGMLFR